MNTKNTKTNMKKSTPEVVKAADTKPIAKAKVEVKTETKPVVKADRPKLTAAYIKEMVAKGLSPLTGKPIRHYSREGKRYAGKIETATMKAEATEAKPVTEKVEAKVKAGEVIQNVVNNALAEAEKTAVAIPVLKAKKGVKKVKKA